MSMQDLETVSHSTSHIPLSSCFTSLRITPPTLMAIHDDFQKWVGVRVRVRAWVRQAPTIDRSIDESTTPQ